MESLRAKQSRFAVGLQRLLEYAHKQGYDVTMGECWRGEAQAVINSLGKNGREQLARLVGGAHPGLAVAIRRAGNGIKNSLHCSRLAVDLQLFKDGEWIQDPGPYRMLGVYWKTLGPGFSYGGDFGDTPHYSIEHEGRR